MMISWLCCLLSARQAKVVFLRRKYKLNVLDLLESPLSCLLIRRPSLSLNFQPKIWTKHRFSFTGFQPIVWIWGFGNPALKMLIPTNILITQFFPRHRVWFQGQKQLLRHWNYLAQCRSLGKWEHSQPWRHRARFPRPCHRPPACAALYRFLRRKQDIIRSSCLKRWGAV